jgi:hypothetical protein
MKRIIPSLLCILTGHLAIAQIIPERTDRLVMSENFDSINGYWTTAANSENLFLVQEGEYILNRKSLASPFAIIAEYKNTLQNFRLVTSINIEKVTNENGSLGIIIMAQPGGDGGFLIEINTLKQYRVRQIAGNTYKYLTGDAKKGGWVTSKDVNVINSYNLIDVRVFNRNYELYINNVFLMSFTEIAYKTGNFGFIIGPGSKGRVDFLYLFTYKEDQATSSTAPNELKTETTNSPAAPDVIELAESIIKLKTQINKLTEQNEDLRRTIEVMKSEETDKAAMQKDFDKTIKQYQAQAAKNQAAFDSLLKVNQGLLKYKEMVADNENSDLIISLSRSLKNEKELNEKLKKENKALTDSLNVLKSQKKLPDIKDAGNENADKQKQSGNFSLPVEN